MNKNTTQKGDLFEKQVFDIIKDLIDNDEFYVNAKKSRLYSKKAYYSKDRDDNIITDISIETFLKGADKYSTLTIIECKNLSSTVSVDNIEEFDSKLRQLGEHNTKGILVSNSGFQRGTYKIARSKGIGLIRIKEQKNIEWVNYRKDNKKVQYDSPTIDSKLYDSELFESNFFAYSNKKTFEYFPDFLIDLGVIDYFINKPKYISIPFIDSKLIQQRIKENSLHKLYDLNGFNFEDACDYLASTKHVKFDFAKSLDSGILGKFTFEPLEIAVSKDLKNDTHRWRFTVAHEIGHLILHHNILSKYLTESIDDESSITLNRVDSLSFNKRLETQANKFACNLLMPLDLLSIHVNDYFTRERIYKNSLYLDNQPCNINLVYRLLNELQLKFNVSKSVAKYRLINLGALRDTTDTSLKTIMRNNL